MLRLGPYTFSETDTHRTLASVGVWWEMLTSAFDPAPAAAAGESLRDHLVAFTGARGGDDLDSLAAAAARRAATAAPDEVGATLALVWQDLCDAAAALRGAGALRTAGRGTVAQVSRSGGGVPKRAAERVEVGWDGVRGDRQEHRVHHGRPWQALCLWSGEVIDTLVAEGHPIGPGAAGENVTVRGLDWAVVRPGVRLRLGSVLVEASTWAPPCRTNARWFRDGEFVRIHHDRGPVSRLYATVVEPGEIAPGDDVDLVP